MMTSISGERGIGKTFFLAENVQQKSLQHYFCVTNFSHAMSNWDLSDKTPEEFWDMVLLILEFKDAGYEMCDLHPSFLHTGVYIAIDEATLYLSADMQKRLANRDEEKYDKLINLLAQARKYDVEIDYVLQDPAKIGKDFRRYTERYVRYTAFINWRKKIGIPHPTKPTLKREIRNNFPWVWEEVHNLDAENPVFNYAKIRDEDGISRWSPRSTLISRKLRKTGRWKDYIYRLYDSYQIVALGHRAHNQDFAPLKEFAIVERTKFGREPYPTFKKIANVFLPKKWKIRRRDEMMPRKIRFKEVFLPTIDATKLAEPKVKQEVIQLQDSRELKRKISRAYARQSAARESAVSVKEGTGE